MGVQCQWRDILSSLNKDGSPEMPLLECSRNCHRLPHTANLKQNDSVKSNACGGSKETLAKMSGLWSENPTPQYQWCLICPRCQFFKWEDDVKPHEWIRVPCCGGCSAGVCRVRREVFGPSAGRVMFMCRVKEGEGSCGYRVWQDELEMMEARQTEERMIPSLSGRVDCNGGVTDVVENDSKQRDGGTDHVSSLVEPSDDLVCREVEVTPRRMDQLKCLEERSNSTSRRPHKRSRCGASGFSNYASFATVRVALKSTSTRHCWMADAIRGNLSTELNGWWGRLVFHPKRCLMSYELKPSTTLCLTVLSLSSRRWLCFVLTLSFRLIALFVAVSNPLEFVVQDILVNLSECLQYELLARLETMDVKDHAAMTQEAEATFAALDCLLFDYKDFKRHRERLDEINRVHAEALEALIDSKNHIKVLQEEISSALDRLFQIEADVSCCEVEMRCLEIELEKTSQNKEALEGKYLIASKELEESQKLIKHSEAERNAAKAAFDRARALLRG
ncbi:hypothetical protein SASPL_151196 [Salvia splendens]|uniref:Zinc finger GRF-type domain-containing protein n=1 Tax=Salvia splendens TaxID=180675 RepID=A0A8X8W7L3_SALSN|nr:hypothetical protein SASPL_151196 [Salvia splendens]